MAWTCSFVPWILSAFLSSSLGWCRAASDEPQTCVSRLGCGSGWEPPAMGRWRQLRWQHCAPGCVHTNPLWPESSWSPAVPGWMPGCGETGTAQWLQREHLCMLPSAMLPWRGAELPKQGRNPPLGHRTAAEGPRQNCCYPARYVVVLGPASCPTPQARC